MRRLFAVLLFAMVCLSGISGTTYAQNTIILSATSQPQWLPSPDDSATFGTPPQATLTSYRGEFFLKANVVGGIPQGTAAVTVDMGKPAIVGGMQIGPVVRPLILPGVEYFMFVSAVGPGGVSARTNAAGPLGFPATPKAVTSPVTFTP